MLLLAIAINVQLYRRAGRGLRNSQAQFIGVRKPLTIQGGDHVAFLEPGLGAWAIRRDVAHKGTFGRRHVEGLSDIGCHFLDHDAQISAANLAGLENLLHNRPRHVDRNGEADSLVATASVADDRGVDAN